MKKATAPISVAGSPLGEVRHVCAFFNSDDEEYRVLLPFIKDGFECGDKAVHVVNPDQRRRHLQRLAAAGIDPSAAEQSGQFELNLAKFGGDTVIDIMRTHPMIIIGGILQSNPFFVPPEEFLREIRGRRARRTVSPSTAA